MYLQALQEPTLCEQKDSVNQLRDRSTACQHATFFATTYAEVKNGTSQDFGMLGSPVSPAPLF